MCVRRFSEPGDTRNRHWHFLGSALTLYFSWQAAVIFGVVAGAQVPASWSLDFAVVLCFIAILVPVVKTRANLAAALVAAAIALAAAGLPYRLALVVASIAGIGAGLVVEALHRRA
jgi:predicted branched-subunit amino acid permease